MSEHHVASPLDLYSSGLTSPLIGNLQVVPGLDPGPDTRRVSATDSLGRFPQRVFGLTTGADVAGGGRSSATRFQIQCAPSARTRTAAACGPRAGGDTSATLARKAALSGIFALRTWANSSGPSFLTSPPSASENATTAWASRYPYSSGPAAAPAADTPGRRFVKKSDLLRACVRYAEAPCSSAARLPAPPPRRRLLASRSLPQPRLTHLRGLVIWEHLPPHVSFSRTRPCSCSSPTPPCSSTGELVA